MHRRAFLTGALAVATAPALPLPSPITWGPVVQTANGVMPLPYEPLLPGLVAHFAEAQRQTNMLRSEMLKDFAFIRGDQWTDEQVAAMYSRTAGYEG